MPKRKVQINDSLSFIIKYIINILVVEAPRIAFDINPVTSIQFSNSTIPSLIQILMVWSCICLYYHWLHYCHPCQMPTCPSDMKAILVWTTTRQTGSSTEIWTLLETVPTSAPSTPAICLSPWCLMTYPGPHSEDSDAISTLIT